MNESWTLDVKSIKKRNPCWSCKTEGFNVKIRKKGYSISVEGSHGEHWYGETGSESPVNPAAQTYVVGWMQLSNSQKLAERQSCYSGPKKNLVEDEWRTRKWPTRKSEGKLHRTKPWEKEINLVVQLKLSTNKRRQWKGYALSLKGTPK